MDQADYVKAILDGDRTVLQDLYAAQLPVICRLIGANGGTEADAKDVFQDAVLVVYRKARQPGFELTSQFGTYFYGICRNLWLNHRAKKFTTAEVTLSEDAKYISGDLSVEADLLHVERGNLFWKAFRQLGEDCRKLLELFFQKIPMETIATKMGYGSEAYARRRKLQCKQRLTDLVKNDPAYRELL